MLIYANREYAEQGKLTPGSDTASFVFIPDLSIKTSTLTEGVAPTAVALSSSKVDVSVAQYGNLVDITDVAKVKSPVALIDEAADRVSFNANESIDQISRDAIAASGTPFYAGTGNTTRSEVAAGDVMTAATLRKLGATMFKNKLMPYDGRHYLFIATAEQEYDLRNDSSTGGFIDVNKYARPEQILNGEIGVLEGFRVIKAQNGPTFASTTTVHAGIALGHVKGWGVADLQSLSIHHVAPGGDHSDPLAQSEKICWKVMFGAAALGNNRYYRVESGATAL
jgi:N4-gp56 family major capsid protein